MSKTNIFSTPEHYEAPVCETIDMMVEMNFLASDGQEKLNPVDGGQGGLG